MLKCLQCNEQNVMAQQFDATASDAFASLCAKCRQLRTETEAVHRLLQQLPRVAAPADFEMRLKARLARAAAANEPRFSWLAWPRWSWAGGGLASLALVGLLWGNFGTALPSAGGQTVVTFPALNTQLTPLTAPALIATANDSATPEKNTPATTGSANSTANNRVAAPSPLSSASTNLTPRLTEIAARSPRLSSIAPRLAVKRKPRTVAPVTPVPMTNSGQDFAVRREGRVFSTTTPAATPAPSPTGTPAATPSATPPRPVSEPTPNN